MSKVTRTTWIILTLASAFIALAGCGGGKKAPYFVASHEPWRDDVEKACLRSNTVRESEWIRRLRKLDGPSYCGARAPFEVAALSAGNVSLKPAAKLRCSMVSNVDDWVSRDVQIAAAQAFGQPVTNLRVAASYSCRPRNNRRGGKLSEHGYANALDVSAFTLADGRVIEVEHGWRGRSDEQQFLRSVFAAACDRFGTVIGPDGDRAHYNHFHMDLARHGRNGDHKVCS